MNENGQQSGVARFGRAILPRTRPGRIAVWLFLAFFVISTIVSVIVAVSGGSPWLALFVFPLGVTAFGGGIAAVIAVVRHGDRGFLILLPVLVALLALIFALGEVIVPH